MDKPGRFRRASLLFVAGMTAILLPFAGVGTRLVLAQALTETVRGRVQLQLANKSLLSWNLVRITLDSSPSSGRPRETYTDADGMYYFSKVPAGRYVLSVETPDRQRQRYAITIAPGPIHDVPPIVLKPARDYVSAFRDGVKAIDSGNWQAAAQSMREAINLQAGADEMVKQVRISGMRLEPYFPHYHLARALTEMGECAGAAKEFPQAEVEIKGTGLQSPLQALRAKCAGSP